MTRRTGGVGAVVVVLVSLVLAAPASAFHTKNPSAPPGTEITGNYQGFDPMEASIPYVAWRGEEVRLVKCRRGVSTAAGEWQIIDWSGDDHVWPKFFDDVDQRTSAFPGRGDQAGRTCWAIDITSHKPGIAVVKLKVDAGPELVGEGDPVLVHQFNVIWMSLDQAILRNLEGGTGGPSGPITENPGQRNRLGVVVKGRVPLNEQFRTELGAQRPALNASSIVLPDAWVDLANTSLATISRPLRLANDGIVTDDPVNPAGPEREHSAFPAFDFWDIHDSTGPYNPGNPYGGTSVTDVCPRGFEAGHNATCHVTQNAPAAGGFATCNGSAEAVNDTVDNCGFLPLSEFGPFSRVFHDVSGPPTIGPYSPTRPDETMLSDSLLTIHDAPMPSALVVARIAPNTGAAGDISGVGSFSEVDKHLVYNRGGAACTPPDRLPTNSHCITAPFSGAYIPPSPTMENNPADSGGLEDEPDTASGIQGSVANNFDGYLPVSYLGNAGLYHYWDIAEERRVARATPTHCVDPPRQGFRPTPSGPQEVALYTDEHGEAQFNFNAGLGFFFDNFIRGDDVVQGACRPVGLIGTADISVNALYPFQQVTHAGVTSNIIQKRIESLFRKGIICRPKPGEEDDKALCVAFGRDIDGTPLTGERVCVTALGDAFIRDFDEDTDSTREGDSTVCASLDPNPTSREDLGTDLFPEIDSTFATETFLIAGRGSVRVIADFRDEHLEFPTTVTIPPATPPPGTTTTTTTAAPPTTTQTTPPEATTVPVVQTTPQTIQTTTQAITTVRPTTINRPTTTQRRVTTVKAKKKVKVKIRKKVKKAKRKGVCIIRGRVVRPCVRGNG
jgi:hypothetical protein